jgi:hypothetical protein
MSEQKQTMRCPNDSCVIPLVAELRRRPKPLVRFFWCRWCQELFAFVGENEIGGRFAASFAFDEKTNRFTLWKQVASQDAEVALEVIADVTFSPGPNPPRGA